MSTSKVPPRQAVDQLEEVLDSPEVQRLIYNLELVRWTGRPGYPLRAMVGMCLVKAMYAIPTWSRVCRLVAEHDALQDVLGGAPSQWACYRFAKQLRTRDKWALDGCIAVVLDALKKEHPQMGSTIAIDASDLPGYAVGPGKHRKHRKLSDPDAAWGYRSAVSNRAQGKFYGYKIDAAVDTVTDLPVAWNLRPANLREHEFAIGLIDKARAHGFPVNTAIMDAGYDAAIIHAKCEYRDVTPVIPLSKHGYEREQVERPNCVHGDWTFAGADYKRKATKWRCPTGECKPASMWIGSNRLHPLIPRHTKKYADLYARRGSVERAFARLKHEQGLTPLRVRGQTRVQLHADLTILAVLASRLAQDRACNIQLAA